MLSIQLLGALSEYEQRCLVAIFKSYPHPKIFRPEEFYTIRLDHQLLDIQISHVICSREADSDNHPDRIWFDVKTSKKHTSGGFGDVAKSLRCFRVDETHNKLIIKDRTQENKSLYVIKFLYTSNTRTPDYLRLMAEREAHLYRLLYQEHKTHGKKPSVLGNVVTVLLPALPGINLESYFKKSDQFKPGFGRFLSITLKSAEAVDHFHRLTGHLHLDLKPSNIMYSHNRHELNLCDFGLSKTVAEAANNKQCIGTPGFMAPEVSQKLPLTKKSDYFSLGRTLQNMIDELDIAGNDDRLYQYQNEITQLFTALPMLSAIYEFMKVLQPKVLYTATASVLATLCDALQLDNPNNRITVHDFVTHLCHHINLYIHAYFSALQNILDELNRLIDTHPTSSMALSCLSDLFASALAHLMQEISLTSNYHQQLMLVDVNLKTLFEKIAMILKIVPPVQEEITKPSQMPLQEQLEENQVIERDETAEFLLLQFRK